MTDPLRDLEFQETTPITELLIQWCKRHKYTTEEAEQHMPGWREFLFKTQGLQDEIAAIEDCTVEQVETWTFLPAGLLRVFKAIIRHKQGILFLWCGILTLHSTNLFFLYQLLPRYKEELVRWLQALICIIIY